MLSQQSHQDAQDTQFKGIRFCSECDNMLDAKEVRDELKGRYLTFECKICNNAIRIKEGDEVENCVYRTEFTMRAQKMKVDPECIKDPTLTRRGDVLCPYCGHEEAVTFTQSVGDKV